MTKMMSHTFPLVAITVLALAGCPAGGAPSTATASVTPATTPSVKPAASSSATPLTGGAVAGAPDPEAIVAAYTSSAFTKINTTGVMGTGPHTAGKPLFVYVDKDHAALYMKNIEGPMPEGTTIVKVSADGPGKLIAIMKKLKTGTDPGSADWYFWERINGTSVPFDGNATKGGGLCIDCHKHASANADNLLGTSLFGM